MGTTKSDSLIRLPDAGRRWDVSPQTIRRWARQGRVRLVRLPSGALRIRLDEVERAERPVPEPPTEPSTASDCRRVAGVGEREGRPV